MKKRYRPLTKVVDEPGYEWATPRYLRQLVYAGRLPYSKPAGKILVDLNDVDALVDAGRVEAAAS